MTTNQTSYEVEQFRAELLKKLEQLVKDAQEGQRNATSGAVRRRHIHYEYAYWEIIEFAKELKP
jgi:hypothetical protein